MPASSSLQPIPAGTSEPAAALAFHPSDPCQSSPLLSEKKQKHSSPSPKASSGAALLGMSSSCHHFEAMSRESGLGPPHSEEAFSTSTFSCVLRQQVQETDIGSRNEGAKPISYSSIPNPASLLFWCSDCYSLSSTLFASVVV